MIAAYVNQLLKIYPSYGRDGTETKTIIRAFQFALEPYALEDIENGFKNWLTTGKQMPLPSDLVDYCKAREKHKRETQGSYTKALPAPPKDIVPWFGMTYEEIMDSGHKTAFIQHLEILKAEKGEQRMKEYLAFVIGCTLQEVNKYI